jgi:Flp pilus assembly protein TadB
MTALLAVVCGAGVGAGLLVTLAGLRGHRVLPRLDRARRHRRGSAAVAADGERQWIIGAGLGAVVWLLTGWLGAGVLAVCAVVVAPRLFVGQRQRKAWIARSEAIAAWTEMLRDTMAAADGVEEAIAATVPIAPAPIRGEVALLDARRRSEQSLPDALAAFARELDHPSGDLVVTALIAAAEGEGTDFAQVLTRLAVIARSEVAMRREVEASRAQVHSSGRMILAVLVVTGAGFAVVSRGYFEPYGGAGGQVALVVVAALFTAGAVSLERMSRIQVAERFTPRRTRRKP